MHLRASQLTKDFGHRSIVKNATLSVNPGEVVTIFGPNGAGKTTLIKILATLLKPTSGELEIEGTDAIEDCSGVRNMLGVVIHETLAYPAFSPYENLKFFGQMYGVKQLEQRATTLLTEVGLQRFVHEPLHIFSRGMTQRFMIARALLHRPSVLLLDEPFSGLDAAAKQFVLERIAQEQQDGKGIIITTHNTELGYLVGTTFFFMINGELEEVAQRDEITAERLLLMYEEKMRSNLSV
ncbi:ABC transporter ATP-binding protein [Candidatus Poribacteria bacterium]|nr:ABC transporter ATP-binding protein [Candidatus Poribacteria bacterium]MYH81158.1 ABC transporter ATP-binding protein [Candidatus Poribacteria bacterium]MYK93735.1 ABC transporter ATP-binding protein [Candidatus Poribacteria bacterium]